MAHIHFEPYVGELRDERPEQEGFDESGRIAWAGAGHSPLVEIEGEQMTVTPIGELDRNKKVQNLTHLRVKQNEQSSEPIVIPLHP